jgi:hypothetical protein
MLDHVATTNGRVASAKPSTDPPGSLLAGLDSAIMRPRGGRSWHQTPRPALEPPYTFCCSVLGLREEERMSGGPQPNPATTAALICSCLTVSAITIVSRLLHVLKSAELISDSGLLAQKFTSQRMGTTPSHHTIPDDVVLSYFACALSRHFGDLSALPSL